MKSVRLRGIADLQTHKQLICLPGTREKLTGVKSIGICGSDLHWFSEAGMGDAQLRRPLALGHEFAGESEDGQGVRLTPQYLRAL
jgi:L-iditol 2-dehydrogenase